jgi:hypothetical protein
MAGSFNVVTLYSHFGTTCKGRASSGEEEAGALATLNFLNLFAPFPVRGA